MTEEDNKDVVRRFFRVYDTHDYSILGECLSTNYIDHSLPCVRSLDDAIAILQSTHHSFPDIQVVINDLIAENDQVVFRGRFRATHLGEFVGHRASGSRIEFEAIEIFKLRENKIVESWGYWPSSEIIKQIKKSGNDTNKKVL